jgi:hypothetical protein
VRLSGDISLNRLYRPEDVRKVRGLPRRHRFQGWIEGSNIGGSRSRPARPNGA